MLTTSSSAAFLGIPSSSSIILADTAHHPVADNSLVRYEHACRAVAECRSVDDAKDIRDKAIAMQVYGRQAKNKDLEADAVEIRMRATRKLGALMQDRPKQGPGDHWAEKRVFEKPVTPTLASQGIDKNLAHQARTLSALSVDAFEASVVRTREAVQRVVKVTDNQLIQQSNSNEHYTPQKYIDAARAVMGAIDLDPASCKFANVVVQAQEFFTEKENGLTKPWSGRVWLNPPYGGQAGEFVEKLVKEIAAKRVISAIVLVSAGATDTQWFQPLWDATALCFTNHRINFYGDGERSGNTVGSVFAYLGTNKLKFFDHFSEFGRVVGALDQYLHLEQEKALQMPA
jgi:hypothetical protein